jgi:hypothetical protein
MSRAAGRLRLEQVELIVLVVGVLLRLALAAVNTQANDDHLSTIRIIARENRLPHAYETWEAFQPKLYHLTVALAWKLSPVQWDPVLIRIAQLISCAAAIGTLVAVRRFLGGLPLRPSVRLMSFAMVAMNPKLIGLAAQATNDSFVILFGTLALASAYAYLRERRGPPLLSMTIFAVLAALAKGNGIVVFGAAAAALIHGLVRRVRTPSPARRVQAGQVAFFIVASLVLVVAFGSYRQNARDLGSPFAINGPRAPRPLFVERTSVYRPGITSIVDGYLTFRFVGLLRRPAITQDKIHYPLHRTSLWSQVYGRAHFVHFDQWPPSWSDESPLVLWIGRAILVLALLPTAMLLLGLARGTGRVLASLRQRDVTAERLGEEMFVLCALGYVAFLIVYTLTYRDFSTMKAEFLFPGLLVFLSLFAWEADRAAAWLRSTMGWVVAALLGFYLADVMVLLVRLAMGVAGRLARG